MVVLKVLQDLDATLLRNCTARRLSIAWGLLAPEHPDEWYSGNSKPSGRSWDCLAGRVTVNARDVDFDSLFKRSTAELLARTDE